MARSHGYVYYEADCFFMFVNPFVDINAEEASLAMAAQKPLKVLFKYMKKNLRFLMYLYFIGN